MKNLVLFVVIIFVLFSGTTPSSKVTAALEERWLYDSAGYARALELQRESKAPLVVYFYADWCPFCQRLDSEYLPAAPVQQYLRGVVKVRINPEHGAAEREIANRYRVRGYPAFFIMGSLSATPNQVHPFRRGGNNLTPAEFASACQQAASFSTQAPASVAGGAPAGRNGSDAVTRQRSKSQIVEVPPSSPTFINNAPLPALDTVLARYVMAIGGHDAQKRITSRVSTGRVDMPGESFGGKLEVYAKAPNKSLTVWNVEPTGLVRQGFDGRSGWSSSETANGIEQAALVDADFYRETRLTAQYKSIKLVGKVKEGFREVYLIEAMTRDGAAEKLYFDVESSLLVRRDLQRQTSKGTVRVEVYFGDWREIDGVKIPFKLTQVFAKSRVVITLDDVKQNVPVDDAIFRRP